MNLTDILQSIFEETKDNHGGNVASYIPQLANIDPELYGVSFCDMSGAITSFGDARVDFCLQSCSKPLTYCLARKLQNNQEADTVHAHVGYEPSGRMFNDFGLNREGVPHNPLINAGAIMIASMVHPNNEPAMRFDAILEFYRQMSGYHDKIGFDNGVFLSEKHHADRNISLAYHMRENNSYGKKPTPSQLNEHLDLYFQTCSISANCEIVAVMSATIANGGICPINGKRVLDSNITKDIKCIMYSCGMYDFSGQFGFRVGLPAKSGVSGCVMVVIPDVGGLCIWSPRLDVMGNSVRGIQFCLEFSKRTNAVYHLFSSSTQSTVVSEPSLHQVIEYATSGQVDKLRSIKNPKMLRSSDYDGRTPLHLACAEGQEDSVRFLLSAKVKTDAQDRWGNKPIDEAYAFQKRVESEETPDAEKLAGALQIISLLNEYDDKSS